MRIDAIDVQLSFKAESPSDSEVKMQIAPHSGYRDAFCSPAFKKATFVGCSLSIFQQLTGINAITFYSSTIFKTVSTLPANQATALVMGVNCVSVIPAAVMLSFYGRRTLMIVWTGACAVFILIMGLATFWHNGFL